MSCMFMVCMLSVVQMSLLIAAAGYREYGQVGAFCPYRHLFLSLSSGRYAFQCREILKAGFRVVVADMPGVSEASSSVSLCAHRRNPFSARSTAVLLGSSTSSTNHSATDQSS